MKKYILFSIVLLILFAGIALCTPATETIFGTKIFNDGIVIKDPNTASIGSTGDARVHSLGVNCAADPNNYSIVADPDADKTFVFGRGKMGTLSGQSDAFFISHYDQFGASGYAMACFSDGSIILQGNNLNFWPNNVPVAYMSTAGLTMAAGKTITVDGLTIQAKSVTLTADPNNLLTDPNSYYTLPTGVAGLLTVWDNTGSAEYHISSTGVVAFKQMDSGFKDSYVKGYICVEDAGAGGRVHNTLEVSDKIRITYKYSSE